MNIFDRKPALRWLTPLAFVAVIGATSGIVATATADDKLPDMSAQELLVHLQQAKVDTFSGTVVQDSNLGIPDLPGISGRSGDASLTSLISGSHTLDVWASGPDKARLRVQGDLDETDVIVNGRSVWNWSYKDKTATHRTLPEMAQDGANRTSAKDAPDLPKTPQEAAAQVLKAVEPTTKVTTATTADVAGQKAYELVLEPQQAGSLVKQVRIAVDGDNFMPLRVQVMANGPKPAFQVAYTKVSFERPNEAQFDFKAPPETKVTEVAPKAATESEAPDKAGPNAKQGAQSKKDLEAGKAQDTKAEDTKVVGTGWTSVVVTKMPTGSVDQASGQLAQVLSALPEEHGSWGTGRVLSGTAFTAVLTDDGRLAVGSVDKATLLNALGK